VIGRFPAVAAIVAVTALLTAAGCASHSSARPSAGQLAAYEQAILPTVQDWGSIEVQGIQPAIADLRSGHGVPAHATVLEAQAWQHALQADRAKLSAVSAPPGLTGVPGLFDRSIARYLDAAALFGRAAAASSARRGPLIDAGVVAARDGDRLYDQASALLQAAHRRLGQSPTPNFPDPTATP
jgi:hypothetical protein